MALQSLSRPEGRPLVPILYNKYCLCPYDQSKSDLQGEASTATATITEVSRLYVLSLQFYSSSLIALRCSENTSMNGGSDEDGSLTHGSTTCSSPPQLSSSSSNSESMHEKSLYGLGYLNNNDDNLLGYLKTVSIYHAKNQTASDVVDEHTRRRR